MQKWIMWFVLLWTITVRGQLSHVRSAMDSSGGRSVGGSYVHIGATGQAAGYNVSSGGSIVNRAGMLAPLVLQPGVDSDGDGVADELDLDNDQDGLTDVTELTGQLFNPITPTAHNEADTDADGASDGQEQVAGTNPGDPQSVLDVQATLLPGGDRELSWSARSGRTYVLYRSDGLAPTNSFTSITTNVAGPGSGPWQVATNMFVDMTASASQTLYRVEVRP